MTADTGTVATSTRRRRRAGVVLAATGAALAGRLLADPLLGQDLRITEGEGSSQQVLEIGLFPVIVASLLIGAAGWAALAALERFTRRARPVWTGVALLVLVASFLPLTGTGMSGGTRASLALLHLAVAAVLIPGLLGRLPRSSTG
ncbi:hypothetical protein DSC45_23105 [Streptomyces sp. YIM 130001]|uniref:DUF6069 family protein n=1 Tax=Streptomyces sp. YIM 130001 TaxID=2259644 RepID=UPI000EEBE22D|nr:DUF6069 family protein [Streptomyces sp. YIM 130001]RII13847.1 hypothetical protein DSC45_23105 [Streptomyces sp. YIM 130001]